MAEVQLKNVQKVYDNQVTAVENLTLTIKDKDFVVLVGPSGCGKSTTLRLIAGLERATGGEIYIGDRLVNDVPPKDRDIAMVFQNYALYPHMTVCQNLAFGLKMRKLPKAEIEEKVAKVAKILDIESLMERKPKALSGGQRQRVALGRAIVRDSKVFLFDEPLSNLDAKLRVQMRAEIAKLHNRLQTTMVYVTHDQVEAMTMGRHIVVMKDGKIQQVDTPLNLYNSPMNIFVAGFIGSPTMNFFEGIITRENGLIFHNENIRVPVLDQYQSALVKYTGKDIIFGIRPEDVFTNRGNAVVNSVQMGNGIVDVIEPMGNETLLYCSTGHDQLIVRTGPASPLRIGDAIEILITMEKCHFFETATGKRIEP